MEPNSIHIDKLLAEYIEMIHYIVDINCEKMNVGEEIKLKELNKY